MSCHRHFHIAISYENHCQNYSFFPNHIKFVGLSLGYMWRSAQTFYDDRVAGFGVVWNKSRKLWNIAMFIFEIVFFYSTIYGINNLSPNGVKLVGLPLGFMWQNVQKIVPYLTTTSWLIVISLVVPFFYTPGIFKK